jgi:hypothetical protein
MKYNEITKENYLRVAVVYEIQVALESRHFSAVNCEYRQKNAVVLDAAKDDNNRSSTKDEEQ